MLGRTIRVMLLTGILLSLVAFLSLGLERRPADPRQPDSDSPSNLPTPNADEGTASPWRQPPKNASSGYGLHYSPDELDSWRDRAERGPYRLRGDVSPHSPGDWDRIRHHSEEFLDKPMENLWEGPEVEGCIEPATGDQDPPRETATLLRDAAFVALVLDDEEIRNIVKDRLLEQASLSGVEFSDRDRWCVGHLLDLSPSFNTSHWMAQHLFAYDYVGGQHFSRSEQAILDEWFYGFAELLVKDTDQSLDRTFVDRQTGNYGPVVGPDFQRRPYHSAEKEIGTIGRRYNNRRAAQMRYVALVGVHQDDAQMKESAKRFGKEYIKFSVWPEGFVGDFDRWTDDNPELGYLYGAQALAAVITIADVLARDGDTELYDYVTYDGVHGSEGGPKSLLTTIRAMAGYLDGTYERYGTDDDDRSGHYEYKIDGRNPDHAHIVTLAPANLYYQDKYFSSIYTYDQTTAGTYPDDPAPAGPSDVWTGDAGIYPGVLFMFGQLEGKVSPYPKGGSGTVNDGAQRP